MPKLADMVIQARTQRLWLTSWLVNLAIWLAPLCPERAKALGVLALRLLIIEMRIPPDGQWRRLKVDGELA